MTMRTPPYLAAFCVFAAGAMQLSALAQQVDPKIHKLCIEAKDYSGCVKSMTSAPATEEDSLTPLRNAMKQVAARLRSGTSLRDSTLTFQPVVDQLAVAGSASPDSLAVEKARLASRMFDALQLAWDTRIRTSTSIYGETIYDCKAIKLTVDNFNSIPGAPPVYFDYKKGLFGINACRGSSSMLPENSMMAAVARVLDEGSVSPSEIAAREKAKKEREEKAKREQELCALGPWNRYLEENPGMKKWAEANPAAAESTKEKFLKDPKNQSSCNTAGSGWGYKDLNYSDQFR
jgi:hypothetical protein